MAFSFGPNLGPNTKPLRRKNTIGGNIPCDNGVVVWEWEVYDGYWETFGPEVSTVIESKRNKSASLAPSGQVDSRLSNWIRDHVDMASMKVKDEIGKFRAIRRAVYPATSPVGRGVTWQWEEKGKWYNFDIDVCTYIDECRSRNIFDVSLLQVFDIMWRIDLKTMTKIGDCTGRTFRVREAFLPMPYPSLETVGTSVGDIAVPQLNRTV